MKYCKKCNKEFNDDINFCVECGEPLVDKKDLRCSSCGEGLKEGVIFCPKCGTKVNQEDSDDTSEEKSSSEEINQNTEDASKSSENKEPKSFIQKYKKLIITAIVLLLLVVSACGGYYLYTNRNIDVTKDNTLKFSGYNGQGTAEISDAMSNEIIRVVGEQVGLDLENLDFSEVEDFDDLVSITGATENKVNKMVTLLKGVRADIDKDSNLRNGQKVKLTIKVDGDANIKEVEKTYVVTGLEKLKDEDLTNLIEDGSISFYGLNGNGRISGMNNGVINYFDFDKDLDGKFSNGDVLTLKLNDKGRKELLKQGIKPEKEEVDITVSGLSELDELDGYDDIDDGLEDNLEEFEDEEPGKKDYRNDLVHVYYQVSVDEITIVNIYKVTENGKKVYYRNVTLKAELSGHTISSDDLYDHKKYRTSTNSSLDKLVKHLKKHYPGLKKFR